MRNIINSSHTLLTSVPEVELSHEYRSCPTFHCFQLQMSFKVVWENDSVADASESFSKTNFAVSEKKTCVEKSLFFTCNARKSSGNTSLRNVLLPCGLKPQDFTK